MTETSDQNVNLGNLGKMVGGGNLRKIGKIAC